MLGPWQSGGLSRDLTASASHSGASFQLLPQWSSCSRRGPVAPTGAQLLPQGPSCFHRGPAAPAGAQLLPQWSYLHLLDHLRHLYFGFSFDRPAIDPGDLITSCHRAVQGCRRVVKYLQMYRKWRTMGWTWAWAGPLSTSGSARKTRGELPILEKTDCDSQQVRFFLYIGNTGALTALAPAP